MSQPLRATSDAQSPKGDLEAEAAARRITARRVAGLGAVGIAVLGAAVGVFFRIPPLPALLFGVCCGLSGLGLWSVFHLVSGRNDGHLPLVLMPLGVLGVNHDYSPLQALAVGLVLLPAVALAALLFRVPTDGGTPDQDVDPDQKNSSDGDDFDPDDDEDWR